MISWSHSTASPDWTFIVTYVLLFLFISQFVARYIITYRLADGMIQVLFFGIIPVFVMFISAIIAVRRVSALEIFSNPILLVFATKLGNRLWTNQPVLIRYRPWLNRYVIITPDNPDEFVAEVQKQLADQPSIGRNYA
jgi:hypothetical protein